MNIIYIQTEIQFISTKNEHTLIVRGTIIHKFLLHTYILHHLLSKGTDEMEAFLSFSEACTVQTYVEPGQRPRVTLTLLGGCTGNIHDNEAMPFLAVTLNPRIEPWRYSGRKTESGYNIKISTAVSIQHSLKCFIFHNL